MTFQDLSKKYSIDVEIIKQELYPLAKEESKAMGKGDDNSYIMAIVEELCSDYLKESFTPKYTSIFNKESRYTPLFGDSLKYSYKPIDFSVEDELEEEADGTMNVGGVQSTDFPADLRPEYPVDGSSMAQIDKKKKKCR
jgi:hypothetical protein